MFNFLSKDEALLKSDYVECTECGHVVSRAKAQTINVFEKRILYNYESPREQYFCNIHRKPYDYVKESSWSGSHYFKNNVEVTSDGKIVK